ncbi:MAG TPA: hypothetical protein DF699_16675, partial [Phycisphaerales bacterium]|nr:hypothetical protein [Phycisphaerales bacterium]
MIKCTAIKLALPLFLLISACAVPVGCSGKTQEEQAADELLDQIDEISRQNREELEAELEDDGGDSMR